MAAGPFKVERTELCQYRHVKMIVMMRMVVLDKNNVSGKQSVYNNLASRTPYTKDVRRNCCRFAVSAERRHQVRRGACLRQGSVQSVAAAIPHRGHRKRYTGRLLHAGRQHFQQRGQRGQHVLLSGTEGLSAERAAEHQSLPVW